MYLCFEKKTNIAILLCVQKKNHHDLSYICRTMSVALEIERRRVPWASSRLFSISNPSENDLILVLYMCLAKEMKENITFDITPFVCVCVCASTMFWHLFFAPHLSP